MNTIISEDGTPKDIYYPGAPHRLTATHQEQLNADLLAFLRT